jgi:CPA1 family monovalent cation:H+ antiporter
VAAGIALRRFYGNSRAANPARSRLDHFWEVIEHIQNSVLFVLLGLEVLAIPLVRSSFETGFAAIACVTAVRLAVVATAVYSVRWFQRGYKSSISILTWGGLRGGLSIALALSVPPEYGRAWILATTYFVVVFSIAIQGGSMDLFLHRQKLKSA